MILQSLAFVKDPAGRGNEEKVAETFFANQRPPCSVAMECSRVLSVSLACNVVWCTVWSLGAALEAIKQVHCVVITLFEEAKVGDMSVEGSSYNASVGKDWAGARQNKFCLP
ncbi:hypothetical protein SUGI_0744660 [Cryptomeria japonica]|nr:hypothetical protein SUGI_0744660 [Cryptomeria japonica]